MILLLRDSTEQELNRQKRFESRKGYLFITRGRVEEVFALELADFLVFQLRSNVHRDLALD